jgi:predicted hotdog family 3-hydroxylacyl-ACP dehydratase
MLGGPGFDPFSHLPHAGVARMLEAVLEATQDSIRCSAQIPLANPFVQEGRAAAFVGLEIAAQAAASLEILNRANAADEAPEGATPSPGYVVSVRDVQLSCDTLPAGSPLVAMAVTDGAAPPLRVYRVSLYVGEERVLYGSISTYVELP